MNTSINYFAVPGLKNKTSKHLHIDKEIIISIVSDHLKVNYVDVIMKNRKTTIALARHMICFLLYKYTDLNKCQIAIELQRDHTKVINSLNRMQNLIDSNDELMGDKLDAIRAKILSNNI